MPGEGREPSIHGLGIELDSAHLDQLDSHDCTKLILLLAAHPVIWIAIICPIGDLDRML